MAKKCPKKGQETTIKGSRKIPKIWPTSNYFVTLQPGSSQLRVLRYCRLLSALIYYIGSSLRTAIVKDLCRQQTVAPVDQSRQQTAAIRQQTAGSSSRYLSGAYNCFSF